MARRRRSTALRIVETLFWSALIGLLLAHALRLAPLGFVERLDDSITDARLRWTAPAERPTRLAIVDIDEPSLAEVGRWPWGRDRLAQLVDVLFAQQRIAALGFDLVFAEPDPGELPMLAALASGDPALAAQLPRLQRELDRDARFSRALQGRAVVLANYFTGDRAGARYGKLPPSLGPLPGPAAASLPRWDGYGASLPLLADAAQHGGFINALPDADGVLRSAALVGAFDGQLYESLALAVWRLAGGAPVPRLQQTADGRLLTGLEIGGHVFTTDDHGRVLIPYRSRGGPQSGAFERVPAADLLAGRVAPGRLAGYRVLVGTSVPALADLRPTPIHAALPGVEVHASLLAGLDTGRLPARPDWARGYEASLLVLLGLGMALSLRRLSSGHATLLCAALLVGLLLGHEWAWRAHGLALPMASALLLLATGYAVAMAWGYLVEGRSRRLLTRLFGSYVPPQLVRRMASDPQHYARAALEADNRELTLLFCDLRDFTTLSEHLEPQRLRELLNLYFSRMSAVVHGHQGTLDKFIGDALMAFWGAPLAQPQHARLALQAALAMRDALAVLNTELAQRGHRELSFGIGLHTGIACVGDMGSDLRRAYTAVGDSVNLASRIEGLTRRYGVDLLVSEQTRAATLDGSTDAAAAERFDERWCWLEVGDAHVMGRARPVTLYTLIPMDDAGSLHWEQRLRHWRLALAAARSQHREQAEAHLRALAHVAVEDDVLERLQRALAQDLAARR